VIEEMAGGQHRADEPRRAEQVRVTQMNRSNSCVDAEVCANLMISKRKKSKKLLTPPTSLEMRVTNMKTQMTQLTLRQNRMVKAQKAQGVT
jgi:hypothetical protein